MKNSISNIEQELWYALYVNSRAEKKVMETLLRKNIEAYVPIVKTVRQWSDRKKTIDMPLLTGYVFVKMNIIKNKEVLQTKGVVNFVHYLGKMACIKDMEIDRLKQIVNLGYHVETNYIKKEYKVGEKVKIISGLLKGIEGYVLENNNGRFIEVVLESIGQSIKVKLPEEILNQTN